MQPTEHGNRDPGPSAKIPSRVLRLRRDALWRYGLNPEDLAGAGASPLATLAAVRSLAARMNQQRNLAAHPGDAVRAGDLNAAALIDAIMRHVVEVYRRENGDTTFEAAVGRAADEVGESELRHVFSLLADRFAPPVVLNDPDQMTAPLEDLLLLWLKNENPAMDPFAELFQDDDLQRETAYPAIPDALREHFRSQPTFGPDDQSLVEMLETPARLFPGSLEQQLSYIRERWGLILGDLLFDILRSLDLMKEEHKAGIPGPGPSRSYTFSGLDPERFSPDRDWMPNVVLIAKSTLVWLDQLSRIYGRDVCRLDQVPDEELDRLASFGINALWLIGLWERSTASRRIKHIGGNPDAEASAYALHDYEIAESLGGWDALDNIRSRCGQRGIRLASDMVPNHTGIDGKWVIEHPDWYIGLDEPPFPGYSFNGEDLSSTPGVGLYLEDHYYDRSDAAVVFRRTDHGSGHHRYIYHGNDGTSMPWNDTAQLDFLNAEVREAVIRTILHVARNFPIIRFDAAMTLAKKHVQRLWYPEPGQGGDIPSRAEHGLTREEFERAMPHEFWREVVDRVAAEAPDTLLLAEAFWMMEGYFVRTLGMHRVYNSAFMNMLKNQENAKYRQTVKNTIEFDKEILKRYVNFMNNPDEDTAVAQFGNGDKYFGVFTLMLTMPGLPMIGHGQLEGFSEKYGMEFRRAYRDEQPDEVVVQRHEREIFPLMRRRYLFSEVDNFLFYDVHTGHDTVNENVFAYSNRAGGERSLVLYNNAYEQARGWIRVSTGYVEKVDGHKEHRRGELAAALGIHAEHGHFCLMHDVRADLWYIRRSTELYNRGLFVSLDGFQAQVFLDIYEVRDNESGHYARLSDELSGRGVADIGSALREIALAPLLDLFSVFANSATYETITDALRGGHTLSGELSAHIEDGYGRFLRVAADFRSPGPEAGTGDAVADLRALLGAAVSVPYLDLRHASGTVTEHRRALAFYLTRIRERSDVRDLLATWILLAPLGVMYESAEGVAGEWGLAHRAARAFASLPADDSWTALLRLLLAYRGWWHSHREAATLLDALVHDSEVTVFLGFNEYGGTVWFNHERFDELLWWLYAIALVDLCASSPPRSGETGAAGCAEGSIGIVNLFMITETLRDAEAKSGYEVARLLRAAGTPPPAGDSAPAEADV